jgi:integrase
MKAAADHCTVGASREASPFLFPAQRRAKIAGEGRDHLVELKGAWRAICKMAGISGVRLHDLRHTYASVLASSGLSLPIIGALLGHTQPATTARYAHLFDDPLRTATERLAAIVSSNGDAQSAAEVIELRRR